MCAIADLRPLEDTFEDHKDIHSDYAEPKDVLLPFIAYAQQCNAEGCLRPCLPDKRPARRNIDDDMHVCVPLAGLADVSIGVFPAYQDIVY